MMLFPVVLNLIIVEENIFLSYLSVVIQSIFLFLAVYMTIAWYELDLKKFIWIFSHVKKIDFKKLYIISIFCLLILAEMLFLDWFGLGVLIVMIFHFCDIFYYLVLLLEVLISVNLTVSWFVFLVAALALYLPNTLHNIVLVLAYVTFFEDALQYMKAASALNSVTCSMLIISVAITVLLFGSNTVIHYSQIIYFIGPYVLFLERISRLAGRDLL